MSYNNEFFSKYNPPSVEHIIVGFSGIDPAPKGGSISIDTPEGEQAVRDICSQQVADYFSGGTINFDSGVIGD